MGKEKTLVKNIGIFAMGTFTSKLLSVILIRLYTSYIPPEDFGYYNLLINATLVIIPISILQITDALYRFLLESNDEETRQNAISNAFAVLLSGYGLMGIGILIANSIFNIKYGNILFQYIICNVLFTFCQFSARGLKHNKVFAAAGILHTAVMGISNVVMFVGFHMDVSALFYSEMLAALAGVVYVEKNVGVLRSIRIKKIKNKFIQTMCKYSVPLLPNAIMWWFLVMGSRYVIKYYLGNYYCGIYDVSAKFPALLMTVNSVFNYSWQESAISEYSSKDRNEYYTKTFKVYMRLLMSAFLILIPLTKYLMLLLVDAQYATAWKYVPFLYMGSMFSAFALFYNAGYLSTKKTFGAFATSIGGTFVSVLICIFLIPTMGIQAAALANMLAFLVVWITRVIHTRGFFDIRIDFKTLMPLLLLSAIYIYLYFAQNIVLDVIMIGFAVILFFFYNKELILKSFNALCKVKLSTRGGA